MKDSKYLEMLETIATKAALLREDMKFLDVNGYITLKTEDVNRLVESLELMVNEIRSIISLFNTKGNGGGAIEKD